MKKILNILKSFSNKIETNNLSFIIICMFFIFSCSNKLEEIKPFQINDDIPNVSVKNMHTIYNSSSRLQAEIFAPIANQYQKENPYMEFIEGVDMFFFDDNFDTTSSLTADYAIYYQKQKLWKATGNVIITGKNGNTMKTEEIYGNEIDEKIYSIKYVEVADSDGTVIRGKGGFESNFKFTEYKFKNVDGIIVGLQKNIEQN